MQYAAIRSRDAVYIKRKVCEEIRSAPSPDYDDLAEPHALLAEFPISVYMTTNYDNFLADALRRQGKEPTSATCSWFTTDPDPEADPRVEPTATHPLVYHLHGREQTPPSLVITENDYLEFLVRMASSRQEEEARIIPSRVLSALSDNPLLFVGYSMQDWTFRVLFHGLLRNVPDIHRRRNVSVQLPPIVSQSQEKAEQRAMQFLTSLFENWRISIYWGSASDFCKELRRRMSGLT